MKSRRAKVLHELAGRPLLGYPLADRRGARAQRDRGRGRARRRAGAGGLRRPRPLRRCRRSSAARATPCRSPCRASATSMATSWCSTATLRSCEPRACERLRALPRRDRRGPRHADVTASRCRAASCAAPTAAWSGSSRSPTPRPKSSRSRRATPASTGGRELLREAAGQARGRQRPGRALSHRRRRHRAGAGPARRGREARRAASRPWA